MPPRNVLNDNSALGQLLRGLQPGEDASVLSDQIHIGHNGLPQVDADLIRRMSNGDLRRVDHVHLNPWDLTEQK